VAGMIAGWQVSEEIFRSAQNAGYLSGVC